jgi:hypothetical protein
MTRRPLAVLATAALTLVLVAAGFVLSPAHAARNSLENQMQSEVLNMLNAERGARGLSAISLGNSTDAQWTAERNAANGTLQHSGPDRFNPPYNAENIGRGLSTGEFVTGQMNSTGHRRAILMRNNTIVGIGVKCASNNVIYVTLQFDGTPGDDPIPPTNPIVTSSSSGSRCTSSTTNPTSTTQAPTTTTTTTTTRPPITLLPTTTTTAPPAQRTNEEKFVWAVYTDFLDRAPNSSEVSHWRTRVGTAAQREQFIRTHAYSDAYIGVLIDRYYQVALGRPADPQGKAHWANVIRNRQMTPAQVGAYFYASPEYFSRSGNDLHRWVTDLYRQLLKREPDNAGRNHWVSVARSQGRQVVATNFYDSRESLNMRVEILYQALLGRGSDANGRTYWGDVIKRSGNDVDLGVSLASSPEYLTRSRNRF